MINVNLSPPIPALVRNADKTKVDIRYSLVSPYANAHIYWDSKAGELMYELEEPVLRVQKSEPALMLLKKPCLNL